MILLDENVPFKPDTLYYGDNLDVLRKYFPDESVDLIYLDPPFNSKANYNILFKEASGQLSEAQIQAFTDSWHWDEASEKTYLELQERADKVADTVKAFVAFLGRNDVTAYLVMMAIRLVELQRVMKSSGSIYLHCDPTASHYLKVLLDEIFNVRNFRNELVWKRTFAHGSAEKWGDVHDTILFYSKSDDYTWTRFMQVHENEYLDDKYRFNDERGRYRLVVLTGPGTTLGESGKEWRGYNPTSAGRHWAVSRRAIEQLRSEGIEIPEGLHDRLELLYKYGFIRFPGKKDGSKGVPEFKLYLKKEGAPLQDLITNIPPVNSQAQERLGYPTQKPLKLLELIIRASSKEGDLVLDPFCGCGTAILAAHQLKRKWFGIDVTHLAISLIKSRLAEMNVYAKRDYQIIGEPKAFTDAEILAQTYPFQFQLWAVSLIRGARPANPSKAGDSEAKKGADKGIDGWLTFREGERKELEKIVLQVKGGASVGAKDVRDLLGTVNSTKSAMGILITLYEPTQPMKEAAMEAEYYESPTWGQKFPKIQIVNIEGLLAGKEPNIPKTFKLM